MWVVGDLIEELALGDIGVTLNGVPGMSKDLVPPPYGRKPPKNPKREVTMHLPY